MYLVFHDTGRAKNLKRPGIEVEGFFLCVFSDRESKVERNHLGIYRTSSWRLGDAPGPGPGPSPSPAYVTSTGLVVCFVLALSSGSLHY